MRHKMPDCHPEMYQWSRINTEGADHQEPLKNDLIREEEREVQKASKIVTIVYYCEISISGQQGRSEEGVLKVTSVCIF